MRTSAPDPVRRAPIAVALQVLMFFPRGGSAQVVRYLARAIAEGPSPWRPRVVSGSLGAPGDRRGTRPRSSPGSTWCRCPTTRRSRRPTRCWPRRPSTPPTRTGRGRPTAPWPGSATRSTSTWSPSGRASWRRPGVLDDVAVAHLHHLTPVHEAMARLRPDIPVVTHLHGTELLMLDQVDGRDARGRTRERLDGAHAPLGGRLGARASRRRRRPSADAVGLLGLAGAPGGGGAQRRRPAACSTAAAPTPRSAGRLWRRRLVRGAARLVARRSRAGRPALHRASRSRRSLDPAATVVLFVGRFTAVKRAALLIARPRAGAASGCRRRCRCVLWGGFPGEWEGEHPADAAARSPVGSRGVPGRVARPRGAARALWRRPT